MSATASSGTSDRTDNQTGVLDSPAGKRTSRSRKSGSGAALGKAREKARTAYGSARERAEEGLASSRETIAAYPLLALAGGLGAGVALAMLLPRSRREQELLGEVGHKVTDAAREAADTAVEAGRQQVDEIRQNAMAKVGEAVVGAVTSGQRD